MVDLKVLSSVVSLEVLMVLMLETAMVFAWAGKWVIVWAMLKAENLV